MMAVREGSEQRSHSKYRTDPISATENSKAHDPEVSIHSDRDRTFRMRTCHSLRCREQRRLSSDVFTQSSVRLVDQGRP